MHDTCVSCGNQQIIDENLGSVATTSYLKVNEYLRSFYKTLRVHLLSCGGDRKSEKEVKTRIQL
jgi:hypothetical protein